MSGGAYEYAYRVVENMAHSLKRDKKSYRRAFAEHLRLIAEAMKDIEWVDSCDESEGHDEMAIRACLSHEKLLDTLIIEATYIRDELNTMFEEIRLSKLLGKE